MKLKGSVFLQTSILVSFVAPASGLSRPSSRRSFLVQLPVFGLSAQVASAYERRDVGGEGMSPEQRALNEQAFATNNRLEKDGLKMETQAEQKASLTAALSEYSYGETSSNIKGKPNKKENKK